MKLLGAASRAALGAVRLGPASRVSLGLTSLMLACLLVLDLFVGIVPDDSLQRDLRERTSRHIAADLASAIGSGDEKALHRTLRQVVSEKQVLSTGVRRSDGDLLFQSGDHVQLWKAPAQGESDIDNVRVPLLVRGSHWGDVEIAFVPLQPRSLSAWMRQPKLLLFLLLGASGFAAFALYLRRVLEYLDPSAVIPDRVRTAFDAFPEGVLVVDAQGRTVLTNASFRRWNQRMGGTDAQAAQIQQMPWAPGALGTDPEQYPWMRAMRARTPRRGEQIEVVCADAEALKLAINCAPIQDANGRIRGCIVTFDDLTDIERVNSQLRATMAALEQSREQIEQQNEELRRLASRDALTGCFNRRALFEQLYQSFDAAVSSDAPLCCIMTDIDYFKSFNDRFGHAIGDRVLQVVAQVLAREIDETHVLGRYGGEEFCIVLPNTTLEQACAVAERLRAEIEAQAGRGLRATDDISVTASFGVAAVGAATASAEELVDGADKALYEAKRAGRNRVVSLPQLQSAA